MLEELQTKFDAMGESRTPLTLRIRRALSWIKRGEREQDDPDAAFIFYWIAFNALYAEDTAERSEKMEQNAFQAYLRKIANVDRERSVYGEMWDRSGGIRDLINNRYVFKDFWKSQNGVGGFQNWKQDFDKESKNADYSLQKRDGSVVLRMLFDRLYVLRNQLLHGGATWQGSVNRSQVTKGAEIMAGLVPWFVKLMMDNPLSDWGKPYYPPASQSA